MRIVKLLVVVLIGVFMTSCVSKYEMLVRSADVDLKYKGAFKYFEEKKELMQWWADWLDN